MESGITKDSFRELFEMHYNPLCNYAFSFVKDRDISEDVVQDVFVQIWKKRNDISSNTKMDVYLFASVKNKAIEWLRREKLFDKYQASLSKPQLSTDDADEMSRIYTMREKLFKSIRQLPPKCREVFEMAKLNGLTYTEIAADLNISVKTVENQMSRALKLLREMVYDNK